MSERKYYCFCADNCKFETMTKEQILAAIAQAAEHGLVYDPDAAVISKVKEGNANGYVTFWAGTQAEFNALTETDPRCIYVVTDSTKDADIAAAFVELNELIDDALKIAGEAKETAKEAKTTAETHEHENYANTSLSNVNYTYGSVNGGDANNYKHDTHIFAFNLANTAYDYGFLDVKRASAAGFTPSNGKAVIVQENTDYYSARKARRISTDGGDTWSAWVRVDEYNGATAREFNAQPRSLSYTTPVIDAKFFHLTLQYGGIYTTFTVDWQSINALGGDAYYQLTNYIGTEGECVPNVLHAKINSNSTVSFTAEYGEIVHICGYL